ncbi:MAG: 16S rRNA (cytidine(1402)-2'-O)-methyltransferase [Candidatus Peribacteraceae bacterium]|nr:16S rRNA (cytidine(1402)-2'-O)-methyltransferase [Candidatus Peribacteraceae bacterium]
MLSIVSVPIGNLGDITVRAKEVLEKCTAVICEDTRVTGQLLKLLGLPKKEFISFHGYTDDRKANWIVERLKKGEHLVLVSDAGTPGISDPGYVVVSRVRESGQAMEVIPGASAFLAALSLSGLPLNQFSYLGFLPIKKGRQTLLQSLKTEEKTIVFYESPHRIEKTLSEFSGVFSDQPDRKIVICRELTKMHEQVVATTMAGLQDVVKILTIKGEFVIVLEGIR